MIRLLVPCLLLLGLGRLRAESGPGVVLAHTEQHSLRSDKIGQTYGLLVSLPAGYATSGKSYPVLYVLDGWHFPLLVFLQENNIYSERMAPVIIINIDHGEVPNVMDLRARDFTPTAAKQWPGSGGAPAFLEFLEKEIIPFVDRTYRTVPTDRGLLGHSFGGTFAIYTLLERPELFQRIVAASPALMWDNGLLVTEARAKLKAGLPSPVRLDLSAGDGEPLEQSIAASTRDFVQVLDELKPAHLDYRMTAFPGENHNSIRLVSFPHGLYWVYRP